MELLYQILVLMIEIPLMEYLQRMLLVKMTIEVTYSSGINSGGDKVVKV